MAKKAKEHPDYLGTYSVKTIDTEFSKDIIIHVERGPTIRASISRNMRSTDRTWSPPRINCGTVGETDLRVARLTIEAYSYAVAEINRIWGMIPEDMKEGK